MSAFKTGLAAVVLCASVAAIALCWQAPEAEGPRLKVTSPVPGDTVRGGVLFTAEVAGDQSRVAAIDYMLNGKSLGKLARQHPYSFVWHSALVWDGPATVQAVARDLDGNEIAHSAPVEMHIANAGGTVKLLQPRIGGPLRGLAEFVMEAQAPDGVEAWSFVLDGHFSVKFGNTSRQTFTLDTRRLSNGRHELFSAIYSRTSGHPPVAMIHVAFETDNGRSLQALRPTWSHLVLKPGTSAAIAPRLVYTDLSSEDALDFLEFRSDNNAVATVDRQGKVTAVAPGSASITAQRLGEVCRTRITVPAREGLPHFSRDGQILNKYDPHRSIFVRTLFHLNAEELRSTPGLPQRAQAASINALTTALYNNPADNPQPDLAAWKSSWDEYWDDTIRTARRYGMALLLTGDDIVRTPKELDNSIRAGWSAEAIQYALTRATESKQAVAVEMMDEVTFLWGDTPAPTSEVWSARTPSIPSHAFKTLMEIMNKVPGRLPISWPVGASSSAEAAGNWLGNPAYSDYSSNFFTWMDWRRAYPHSASLPQDRAALERVTLGRLPFLQPGRPILLQTSICGPFYTKRGAGGEFKPGQDVQQEPAVGPIQAAAQIMYAAAIGAAGVRTYSYDWELWKQERSGSPIGYSDMQTGADAFEVGRDRWAAMSAAFGLLARIEPHLLQSPISAVDLGADFVTAARESEKTRLVLATNFSETPNRAAVDLSAYRFGESDRVIRYRQQGARLSEETAALPTGDLQITFLPGETIAWVIQRD